MVKLIMGIIMIGFLFLIFHAVAISEKNNSSEKAKRTVLKMVKIMMNVSFYCCLIQGAFILRYLLLGVYGLMYTFEIYTLWDFGASSVFLLCALIARDMYLILREKDNAYIKENTEEGSGNEK